MDRGGLGVPDWGESLLCPQGDDPEVETQDDREYGVDDNEVSRKLEPATSGHGNGWESKSESGEDKHTVDNTRYEVVLVELFSMLTIQSFLIRSSTLVRCCPQLASPVYPEYALISILPSLLDYF